MAKNPFGNTTETSKKKKQTETSDVFSRMSKLASQNLYGGSGITSTASKTYESKASRPTAPTVSSTVGSHLRDYGEYVGNRTEEEEEELRSATLKDITWNALKQGYYNSLYGKESYAAMMGDENDKQKYEELLAGEDYRFAPDNAFEEAVAGAANLLGQQINQWTDKRSLAMAGGAGATAFLVGQAGPQALIPEEVFTVPFAVSQGLRAGSTMSNFEIEAGLSYNELLESGVSPETAKAVALSVGGVNAGLEFFQMDELFKSFKILKNNPATEAAADTLGKRLLDLGFDVTKNVGKETVQEVAQEGTTIAGTQIGSKIDTGEWAYTSEEVGDRLFDTAKSSALSFGLMNVPHIAVGTHNAVSADRTGSKYSGAINELVDEGLQSDPDSESYKMASALKTRLDNGGKVSNTEAYDLAVANQRAINAENKLRTANTPSATRESTAEPAPAPTRVQTIQSRLAESGMEATQAEAAAQSIDRILSGDTTVTNKDKNVLSVGNNAARAIFEEEAGVKLPATNSSTRKAVSEYVAQAALSQQRQETAKPNVMEEWQAQKAQEEKAAQLKNMTPGSAPTQSAETILRQAAEAAASRSKETDAFTVKTDMASLGANGQRVYQKHLGNAKSVVGFSNAFQRYYDAGQIGVPFEQVKTAYDGAADRSVLYEAYSAGVNDVSPAQKENASAKNKALQKAAKKATRAKGKFYDNRTSEGKSVDENTVSALKQMAKTFNLDIELVDSIDVEGHKSAANGYYSRSENKLYLAADSNNPLMTVAKHEITHYIQKASPKKYKELKDYVMKAYYSNSQEAMNAEIERRIKLAAANDVKLTREGAMDEIVADATESFLTDRDSIDALIKENRSLAETILNAIRDVLRKIEAAMKGVDLKGFSDFMNADQLKQAEKMWVEALMDAANEYDEFGVRQYAVDVSDTVQYSIRSLAEAGGFKAVRDENGIISLQRDGARVSEVTIDDIDNSPIGALINYSFEKNFISEADSVAQKELFADLLTMAAKSNDFAMSMQFAGSAIFTAIKSNSDKQYNTTYDFPSICTKTQAVIDSMSAAMKAKKGGLTKREIEHIYNEVFHDGNPVPCPECYVFSRWVGIGSLLDNIWTYQNKYADMTKDEVQAQYLAMEEVISKVAEENNLTLGKAKGKLASQFTKRYNDLYERVTKAENQGEKVSDKDRAELAVLKSNMELVKSMTWIDTVYFKDKAHKTANPKSRWFVPVDVLFDLNEGERFANDYPAAWGFRTTQGAGYGKAITPYAEAVLGEGILGTNSISNLQKAKKAGTLDNIFLKQSGTLDKTARKKLDTAIQKMNNQAFIGGQRFQSTSDARFENAFDYLIACLEVQAMHGMVQVYTKVAGAVPSFAAWGFSTNQSLMPKGSGLDANGKPVDTAVGGMNPEVARSNRKKFDTQGTITIGVNDNHIRALMNQVWRDFIIPYHASGGDASLIQSFRQIQDSGDVNAIRSTDYTRTQGDKVLSDEVLRNYYHKTQEEIDLIHARRKARIDLFAMNLSGKRKANPDMDVVRGSRFLSDLYDKLSEGGEWAGVTEPKTIIESQLFPNEYWDQTVTYDNSGKITQDYLDYCEELGILHRFSGMIPSNGTLIKATGYDENGNRVKLTDLAYNEDGSINDFFWKVLTDRRMYDNAGNYLPQRRVSLSTTQASDVEEFAGTKRYGEKAGRQYDPDKSAETAERVAKEISDGKQFSLKSDETLAAEAFLTHISDVIAKGNGWRERDVTKYIEQHSELNFVERIYEGEKAAKSDLTKFLNAINDTKVLDGISWYIGEAYGGKDRKFNFDTGKADYPYRGAVRTFRNAIKKRINDIMAESVGGTDLGIKNGDVSMDEVRELYARLNSNKEMAEFAEKVFDTAEKLGVNIRFANQTFSKNVAGDNLGDMVEYKTSYFNDRSFTDQRKANTLLHEMIHACTVYVMIQNTYIGDVHYSGSKSDNYEKLANAATRLNRIYLQIRNDPSFQGKYGITNPREMVAELANEDFVALLKKKSLWDEIVDWICELFGIRRGNSAYENARMCVDYILDNPEVSEYKEYAKRQRTAARREGFSVFGETQFSLKDSDYMKAVENGDMETAQRMVDEAAKAAGYNVEAWHGTRSKERFTVFRTNEAAGNFGSHFTTNNPEGDPRNPANVMGGERVYHVYLKAQNPFETFDMYADDRSWQAVEIDRLAEEIGTERAEEIRKELRKFYPLDDEYELDEYRDSDAGMIKNDAEDQMLENFMRELLEAGGYDSLAYQNDHEGTFGEEYDYVILNPEQIKSADPVTYDADGNVIPLSKRFNEESDDIRYSLKSDISWMDAESQKIVKEAETRNRFGKAIASMTNDRLNKTFAELEYPGSPNATKGYLAYIDPWDFLHMTTTSVYEFLERNPNGLNEGVSEDWGVKNNIQQSGAMYLRIDENGKVIGHEGRHRMAALYREGYEKVAIQIRTDMVKDAKPISIMEIKDQINGRFSIYLHRLIPVSAAYHEVNAELFGHIKTFRGEVPENIQYQLKDDPELADYAAQIRHEAKAVTDAEIMSQAIKDMKLTGDERTVVKNYQDAMKRLADYEKELAVYEATEAEHSKHRSIYTDASGKVKKSAVKYSAKEKAEIQRKIEWWKNHLKDIERKEAFQKVLKREKAKMAETHAKKMSELRTKYNQRIEELRKQRDKKVETEKQKMRDYKQHQRDSKAYKALKAKLEANVQWLSERLVHPTDAKHIPDDFKRVVASFLETLDFTTKGMEKRMAKTGEPSKKVINMWALIDAYQKIALDDTSPLVLTPIEEDLLKALKETFGSGKKYDELTYDELEMVHDIIRYIKTGVVTANKAFNAEIKESISAMGDTVIAEQRSKKVRKDHAGIFGEADKLMNYDNVAPDDKFHEFGGVMEKLYDEIRSGFDQHIENVKTAISYTQNLTAKHKADIQKWSGKKAKATKYTLSDGSTIELTPAQVMSLYALMKRDQAVGHVLGSGIVPSDVVVSETKQLGKKVKLEVAKKISAERASRCTVEDIQKIVSTLTADQKRIADGVVRLFTTKCADWGNETAMKLYGYKKFTEPNYFPIKSSDAYLNARFDDSGDVLIKNLGFTKNTVVNANNPIVVEDIFDVLADHVNKMSMYNALVVPLTDFSRVFNYKIKDAEGNIVDSVQKALETSGGKLGIRYINQFIKDVNKQANSLAAESFINQSIGRYKKAKIAASARVLLQQPTAITRAAAMVDPKYLIKGLQQKANYEEMLNHSEIAYWKSLGFYQTDMARNMKDILLDNESKLDQVTMGVYGKADDFAWGHLWNAIKLEQADAHPDMDKTSSEFLDLVKERFKEVVDRTQVVDSVFHRSQIMRSPGAATKIATAFMAESTKSFNLLRTDLIDSLDSKDYGKVKRSVATYVANAILVSAFAGIADMIRDDDDEDDEGNKRNLWDKYRDAVAGNVVDNINPLNMIPYIKELSSMLKGYDINRMEMASLAEFVKTAGKWTQDKYSYPYLIKETAEDLSELFGIPLKNAVRDVTAMVRTAGDIVGGNYYADYLVDKMKYNIANSDNRSIFYKHYTDALLAGEDKAAAMILNDMVINGIPYDNIIAKGYQKEKEVAFSEARNLIAKGETDEAKKLIRELAKKYDKKYTTLWKSVKNGDPAETPEETYNFNDLKTAVRKGQDTEVIEDYLTEYGGYSEEAMEEAIKMLTEKYR